MNNHNLSRHTILILGGVAYSLLCVLALIYFKERTVFLDVTYRIFQIARTGELAIQANRFGEMLTQWMPLLMVQLKMPLTWVGKFYYVGVVLYFVVLFLICIKMIKQPLFGLCLIFFNTFMVSYTFWWMQIEFAQGIGLSILFFAWLGNKHRFQDMKIWEMILYLVFMRFLIYFHPLLPFVILFSCFYFLFDNNSNIKFNKSILHFTSLWVVVEFVLKKTLLKEAAYDNTAITALENFSKIFPDYFSIQSNKDFLNWCLSDYYMLPIGLVAIAATYVKFKQFKRLAYVFLSFFLYLLLINVSFYKGFPQFHIESFYLPLSVIVIIPLIFDVLPTIQNRTILISIVALILVVRVTHIWHRHEPYTARVEWQEQVIENTNEKTYQKLFIKEEDAPMDLLLQSWGSGLEFWLLSMYNNPDHPRNILVTKKIEKFEEKRQLNRHFIYEWQTIHYNDLPEFYFPFKDTSEFVLFTPTF